MGEQSGILKARHHHHWWDGSQPLSGNEQGTPPLSRHRDITQNDIGTGQERLGFPYTGGREQRGSWQVHLKQTNEGGKCRRIIINEKECASEVVYHNDVGA